MTSDVTFVITSCERPDRLELTLASLEPLLSRQEFDGIVIIEDSDGKVVSPIVPKNLSGVPIDFICNGQNIGQLRSIDKVYSQIDTSWIFHCEDDWIFGSSLWLPEQKEILDEYQNVVSIIVTDPEEIRRRSPDHFLNDPVATSNNGYEFWISSKARAWGGYSFNPGLRRRSDYLALGNGFAASFSNEKAISGFYKKRGKALAILKDGDVRHSGTEVSAMRLRRRRLRQQGLVEPE